MMEDSRVQGQWLSILDYAHQTGKSISTVRRYIKSEKVQCKLDDGKYYIWLDDLKFNNEKSNFSDLEKIELELKKKEEEICELKMLVRIYENKIQGREEPPALPIN